VEEDDDGAEVGRALAPAVPAVPAAQSGRANKGASYSELRRPVEENEWWSCSVTKWDSLAPGTRLTYSHIGRIEETPAGEVAEACQRCAGKGWACKKYRTSEAEKFGKGMAQSGNSCSRCRHGSKKCIPAGQGTATPRRTLASRVKEVEAENAALEAENAVLRAKVRRLERENARLKRK